LTDEVAGTYTPRSLQAAKAVRARRSFQQHFESGKRVRVRRIGFMKTETDPLDTDVRVWQDCRPFADVGSLTTE